MPRAACCHCKVGRCVDCKCALASRTCSNCASPACSNGDLVQKTVVVPLSQITSADSADHDEICPGKQVAAAAASAESSSNDERAPSNWTLYRGSLASCILQMYQSPGPGPLDRPVSNLQTVSLIESFLNQTWTQTRSRGGIQVVSVSRIENPLLYRTLSLIHI